MSYRVAEDTEASTVGSSGDEPSETALNGRTAAPDMSASAVRGAVRSGARWVTLAQIAVQLVRLVGGLAIALLLGRDDFGLVSLPLLIVLFLDVTLKDLGFSAAVVQRKEDPGPEISSLFWMNVIIGTTMSGLLFIGGPTLAGLMHQPEAGRLVSFGGIVFGLSTPAVIHWALLRRSMNFSSVALLQITTGVLTAGLPIVLALMGWGPWAVVWGSNLSALVVTSLAFRLTGWRPMLRLRWSDLRPFMGYSLNLSASRVVTFATANGDRLMVIRWLGTAAIGIYNLAFRMMLTPIRLLTTLALEVLMPGLSRMQDRPAEMALAFRRAIALNAVAVIPFMFTLHVSAYPLVDVLPEEWKPAAPVVAILAMVGALQGIMSLMNSVYMALGRTRLQFMWSVVVAVVSVSAYAIGLQWGVVGVAWGYLAALSLLFLPHIAIPARLVGVGLRRVLVDLVPILASGAVLLVAGYGARTLAVGWVPLYRLVFTAGVAMTAYLMALVVTRPGAVGDLIRLLPLPARISGPALGWFSRGAVPASAPEPLEGVLTPGGTS